jgi:hypothetical protein
MKVSRATRRNEMATVTKIEQHVSANMWADGCEMDGVDDTASFLAYLDALVAGYRVAYPDAVIEVGSMPGDLRDRLEVYVDGVLIDGNHDEQRWVEEVAYDVWQRGDFWRMTGDAA